MTPPTASQSSFAACIATSSEGIRCPRKATITVRRGAARNGRPVCDDHARYEVLLSERYGYAVSLVRHGTGPGELSGQLALEV